MGGLFTLAENRTAGEESTLAVTVNTEAVGDYSGSSREYADEHGKVLVALIDTGSDDAEFYASVIKGEATDGSGHGTLMDGLIREKSGGNVCILSIKALDDDGGGDLLALYEAAELALEENVDIINMSLSKDHEDVDYVLDDILLEAENRGIPVVCAAGNESGDIEDYTPANIEALTTVGACNENREKIASSNYGTEMDYWVEADSTSEAAAMVTGYIAGGSLAEAEDVHAGYPDVTEPEIETEGITLRDALTVCDIKLIICAAVMLMVMLLGRIVPSINKGVRPAAAFAVCGFMLACLCALFASGTLNAGGAAMVFAEDGLTLNKLQSGELHAVYEALEKEPGDIEWYSDHWEVASVDDGTVTGHGIGTATITAVSGNSRAECEVTVEEAKGTDAEYLSDILNETHKLRDTGSTDENGNEIYEDEMPHTLVHRTDLEEKIIAEINDFRTAPDQSYLNEDGKTRTVLNSTAGDGAGQLASFAESDELMRAARIRAEESCYRYADTRPDGSDVFSVSEYVYGETVFKSDSDDPEAVMRNLVSEDGTFEEQTTRRYILSTFFDSVGATCVQYDDEYYWVIEFG